MTHTLRLLNWNLEWAKPNSIRGQILYEMIFELQPDIICITEGYLDFLPETGHEITSTADYGYKQVKGRRKVLLWSKNPWHHVTHAEHGDMPTGRYAEGVTDTILGKVRVLGVCIPWSHAHVNTGQKNRKAWEDHQRYLDHLNTVIPARSGLPTIVCGDFNQRIPRTRAPYRVYNPLMALITEHQLQVPTAGIIPDIEKQIIDHALHDGKLMAVSIRGLPAHTDDGIRLSDHAGIIVDMRSVKKHH